jgi:hypothetical protein
MPVIQDAAGNINGRLMVHASLDIKGDPISKLTREKGLEAWLEH